MNKYKFGGVTYKETGKLLPVLVCRQDGFRHSNYIFYDKEKDELQVYIDVFTCFEEISESTVERICKAAKRYEASILNRYHGVPDVRIDIETMCNSEKQRDLRERTIFKLDKDRYLNSKEFNETYEEFYKMMNRL